MFLPSQQESSVWSILPTMPTAYYHVDASSDRIPLQIVRKELPLSPLEKAYILAVERGDYASVRQALEESEIYFNININCVDALGRTALLISIQNENIEIIELLLKHNVNVGDALLHAIDEEVVEAVELLLNHKAPKKDIRVSGISAKKHQSDLRRSRCSHTYHLVTSTIFQLFLSWGSEF